MYRFIYLLVSVLFIVGGVQAQTLEPVAHFPADGTPEDVVGGHNGSLNNGVTYRDPGVIGQSFQFDGQDDFLSAPFTQQGPFSVSLWVDADEITQSKNSGIIASSDRLPHPVGAFQISFDGETPGSYLLNVEQLAGNVEVPIGFATTYFQHVAVTYDGTTISTYLDGQHIASASISTARFNLVKLGVNRRGNRRFNGFVDEVKIYNSALSAAQVAELALLPNPAPVANNSAVSGNEDTEIIGQADAQDAFGDPLTFSLIQDVQNGSLTLNGDGSFTYQPNPNFFGADAFTFSASDGNASSNEATVSITVNPVNDPPFLKHVYELTVDGNGFGDITNKNLYAPDPDNTPAEVVYEIVQEPLGGSLKNAFGQLVSGSTFTQADLDSGGIRYTNSDPGIGKDYFIFVISDGENTLRETKLTIRVIAPPPVAVDDENYETFDNTLLTVDAETGVLANDLNPSGLPLLALLNKPAQNGKVILKEDGSFIYYPNPVFVGIDQFVYEVVNKDSKEEPPKKKPLQPRTAAAKDPQKPIPGTGATEDNIGVVTITVKQSNLPPVAKCQDIELPLDANGQATLDPAWIDNGSYDPEKGPLTFIVSPDVFTCDNLGENKIVLTVMDEKGAKAICDAVVTVIDVTPPTITLTGDALITLECGVETYTEAGATVKDACDADAKVVIAGEVTDAVGEYVITYDATDASGNAATQVTRTVKVVDTTAPVITLTGDADITLECGIDTYAELGATAADICDPNVSVVIGGSVNLSLLGDYTVTYDATDASGNVAAQVIRTVHVVDTTAPVITLTGDGDITLECGIDTYAELGATVTDNCDQDVSVVVGGSVDLSLLGDYTVTYDATDASGNVATQVTRTVHVVDTTAPEILSLVNYPDAIECVGHDGTPVLFTVLASDKCDQELQYEWHLDEVMIGDKAEFTSSFGLGTHSVSVTVIDDSENAVVDHVVFEIVDTTAPIVSATATSEFLWPPNHKYHTLALSVSAEDICDPSVSIFNATVVSSEADGAQVETKGKGKGKSNGDGNTTGDIRVTKPDESVLLSSNDSPVVAFNPIEDVLELRAERSGNGEGRTYTITITGTDASGNESDPVVVEVKVDHDQGAAKIALSKPAQAQDDGALTFGASNFPNPFNPITAIQYTLADGSDVSLIIYNILGQEVRTLVQTVQSAGVYTVSWNGQDMYGRQVASGMYVYRLVAGQNVMIKKMLLMK